MTMFNTKESGFDKYESLQPTPKAELRGGINKLLDRWQNVINISSYSLKLIYC